MIIRNKEFLIEYLDNIYEIIGKFDTILDVLMFLCIGKTDKVKDITDSLCRVLDEAIKLLENLSDCSDYIDESLLAFNDSDIESKQGIIDNNKKLIDINSKIMKKVKDTLVIVEICSVYSYLILGEQAPKDIIVAEKASKMIKEKSTDEIFDDLLRKIEENMSELSNLSQEIIGLNNQK